MYARRVPAFCLRLLVLYRHATLISGTTARGSQGVENRWGLNVEATMAIAPPPYGIVTRGHSFALTNVKNAIVAHCDFFVTGA